MFTPLVLGLTSSPKQRIENVLAKRSEQFIWNTSNEKAFVKNVPFPKIENFTQKAATIWFTKTHWNKPATSSILKNIYNLMMAWPRTKWYINDVSTKRINVNAPPTINTFRISHISDAVSDRLDRGDRKNRNMEMPNLKNQIYESLSAYLKPWQN